MSENNRIIFALLPKKRYTKLWPPHAMTDDESSGAGWQLYSMFLNHQFYIKSQKIWVFRYILDFFHDRDYKQYLEMIWSQLSWHTSKDIYIIATKQHLKDGLMTPLIYNLGILINYLLPNIFLVRCFYHVVIHLPLCSLRSSYTFILIQIDKKLEVRMISSKGSRRKWLHSNCNSLFNSNPFLKHAGIYSIIIQYGIFANSCKWECGRILYFMGKEIKSRPHPYSFLPNLLTYNSAQWKREYKRSLLLKPSQ